MTYFCLFHHCIPAVDCEPFNRILGQDKGGCGLKVRGRGGRVVGGGEGAGGGGTDALIS